MAAPVLDPTDLARSAAPHKQAFTCQGPRTTTTRSSHGSSGVLLPQSWMCVGRSDELARPGDRRALTVGAEPVVLTRDGNGVLHALSNVCRHRGHEVVAIGDSSGTRLQCPYHAWTCALDGRFRGGPRLRQTPGFDRTDPAHGLVALGVAEWRGWMFVAATHDPPAFGCWIDGLSAILEPYRLERVRPAVTHDHEVAADWKLPIENHHECYHSDEIHPELCRVSSPRSGTDILPSGAWRGGTMERSTAPRPCRWTGAVGES